ncbi:MAG: glycosyltransferase family A protein [Cyanobacteria bacterium P01_E01_bin.6]
MNDSSPPNISVIIPVFNDAAHLRLCLDALENQSYDKEHYEVVVVDNGSTEDIQSVVNDYPQARYCLELSPGSYAARNTGIETTTGDLVAFTDADCIPSPDWLAQGVQAFLTTENCGLIAGHIDLFFLDATRPTPVELYDAIKIGFPQQQFIEESHYGATANVFTSRNVLRQVGLFNASLKSSGDREWGQRVFTAGYTVAYGQHACVAHPARHTWKQLRKKVVRIIGGHLDLKRQQGHSWLQLSAECCKESMKDFLPPFRMYFYIWSYESLKNQHQRFQFLAAMLFVRYVRGWERMRWVLGGVSTRG